ncbi:hypothetical protein M9Y10_019681 [Tritrichomonas musculus]|uniref:Uncharacterized protein n=1 Tax=Tritrichomonas musculus TaxID=1915356 RepID=A0ABR2HHX0_9EUKA
MRTKQTALPQIAAAAGGRYNAVLMEDTHRKLLNLLSQKFVKTDYSGASRDIERIVLIDIKREGYEAMQSLVNDVKENNSRSQDSLAILKAISEYDRSQIIKKNLKPFRIPQGRNVQIPHSVKVLFDADSINLEDIVKYEGKIKAACNLSDDFFTKAVQTNSRFSNYGGLIYPPPPQFQPQAPIFNVPNPYANITPNAPPRSMYPSASTQILYPPSSMTANGPRNTNVQYYQNPPFQPPDVRPGTAYY